MRTITVEVRPLSGESFDIKLDASHPTVGEAKEQIERDDGTKPEQQLLCRVQVSSDGSNVREFDQEPEELKEDEMSLMEGDVVAMGVMPTPKRWCVPQNGDVNVNVCENGKLVMNTREMDTLVHTGEELTEGKYYCEMEIVGGAPFIGVCRPDANPNDWHGWWKTTKPGSKALVTERFTATAGIRRTTYNTAWMVFVKATAWASSSTYTMVHSPSSRMVWSTAPDTRQAVL